MAERDVVFLLGAGASRDAGFPLMDQLTEDFIPWLQSQNSIDEERREVFTSLFERAAFLTASQGSGKNIEKVMRLLADVGVFKRPPHSNAVHGWKKPFSDADNEEIEDLLRIIREYIRESLQLQGRADRGRYLSGLFDFIDEDGLDIFTLNYDRLLETVCFREQVRFTTGFGDEWDPGLLGLDRWEARIHKLHGSVDWYRIPSLGLIYRGEDEHYAFPQASSDEALLYPAGSKEAHAEPFATLMSNFNRALTEAKYLVAIGYSFQDDHIRRPVLDHLRTNRDLQVLVVGPNPEDVIYEPLGSASAPSFMDYPDRVVGLWTTGRRAAEDRQVIIRIGEVRDAEKKIAEIRQNTAASSFGWSAKVFLQLLDQCRWTDMPGKPHHLFGSFTGEAQRERLSQQLAKEAAYLLVEVGVEDAGLEESPTKLSVREGDRGEALALCIGRWIAAEALRFSQLSEQIEEGLRKKVKIWFVGRALVDSDSRVHYWPLNGSPGTATVMDEVEQLQREFRRYGVAGYPGMSTGRADQVKKKVEDLVSMLTHIRRLNERLGESPRPASTGDGRILYPRTGSMGEEEFIECSKHLLRPESLSWLPEPRKVPLAEVKPR